MSPDIDECPLGVKTVFSWEPLLHGEKGSRKTRCLIPAAVPSTPVHPSIMPETELLPTKGRCNSWAALASDTKLAPNGLPTRESLQTYSWGSTEVKAPLSKALSYWRSCMVYSQDPNFPIHTPWPSVVSECFWEEKKPFLSKPGRGEVRWGLVWSGWERRTCCCERLLVGGRPGPDLRIPQTTFLGFPVHKQRGLWAHTSESSFHVSCNEINLESKHYC